MPKYTPKEIQKEIESGQIWPVYWIFGPERMKARELLKKIQKTVLGETDSNSVHLEKIDATEVSETEIADLALSPGLFGGRKIYLISESHRLSDAEALEGIWGERFALEENPSASVLIFLSRDLDARKKLSKVLLAKAAVVECEEVREEERGAWVQYLSKRRGLSLDSEWMDRFCRMDPWSLEGVDLELEKLETAMIGANGQPDPTRFHQAVEVLHLVAGHKNEVFVQHFLNRQHREALALVESFADQMDEALPLMGLLAWNARFLVQTLSDQDSGARTVKLSPQMAERLKAYARHWSLEEAIELQAALAELDFGLKQTSRENWALWTQLVNEFALHA
jgi:DNA polymerase III delta subunit